MTYKELDSISVPGEPFGEPSGTIVSRWDGEWKGRSGTWLLVDIPNRGDGTSHGIADLFVGPDGSVELVGVSEFS